MEGPTSKSLPELVDRNSWMDLSLWVQAYRSFCQNHWWTLTHGMSKRTAWTWSPTKEARWIRAFLHLLHPESGSHAEWQEPSNKLIWVDFVMQWYFKNYRKPFVPVCAGLDSFCRKFHAVEAALKRLEKGNLPDQAEVYGQWWAELERRRPKSYRWFHCGGHFACWQRFFAEDWTIAHSDCEAVSNPK